jgi:hypothetical protein
VALDFRMENGGTRIVVRGRLTEDSRLEDLLPHAVGSVTLDLAGVNRINSAGVREWMGFMRSLPRDTHVTLENCPVAFVHQLNMIAGFAAGAEIRSFAIPYFCAGCGETAEVVAPLAGPRPTPPCPRCGKPFQPDVIEEEYFSFLADGAKS